MTFIPGLGEKIALSLTMDLVKASTAKVRRLFSASEAQKALQASIAAALDEALKAQDLEEIDHNHYASLFERFFRKEAVLDELTRVLDARPGVEPDFAALSAELENDIAADLIDHFQTDAFLRTFVSAFYAAAAQEKMLRDYLGIKLQGEAVARLGVVAQESRRSADASEQIVLLLQRFLEDQNARDALLQAVLEARGQGMLAAFQAFEGIAAGMFKAGFDFGVGKTGLIEIGGDLKALPPAQADTIRALASDLRQTVLAATPGPEELDALEQRYRQHVIRWFENLQFQGLMRTPRAIVLPLEDIYVELRAVAEVPDAADAFSVEERRLLLEMDEKNPDDRREMMSQLDALRRERWSRTLPERKSIAESLHQRDRRAFVILGDPGSGKTTLLHFLALVYARGPQTAAERLKIDPPEADRLPIFVPLAAFDDMLRESRRDGGSLNLLDFLPRYYDRRRGLPGLEPLFRRALTSGRAIVLLDGLDEVIDVGNRVGTRAYVAEQAGALINEWSPRGVRFAVSSRFVGYREAPVPGNLPTLSVLDFGMPEIEIFVHRWAEAYEKWAASGENPEMFRRARTLEADLLADVKSNESVRRLAANPLMITMLALLRRQVGRLPHRRVQLYESYVGALLENWVDARSQGAREQSVEILDRHQAENLLIPLALWLQKEKPSGTAGRAEIQQKLTDICLEEAGLTGKATRPQIREAEEKALRFLQEMRQMTGLLIERGHDAFGFLHLTFQEYFAGRALARLSDEDRRDTVRPNRHDPRWREPILLCAGRLGVVENRRAQVTEFVRGILDCPDDTEEKLHRNLLLALAIAGDDVNLEPRLVSEMVGRAVACLSTRIETLVKGLVGALGQLVANGAAGVEECFGKILASRDDLQRRFTVQSLARFAGVACIQKLLLEWLEDSPAMAEVFEALRSQVASEEVVRARVMDKLTAENTELRIFSVRTLAELAETNQAVREALLERLSDADPYVRIEASLAMVGSMELSSTIRLALLSNLRDPIEKVQEAAIRALSGAVATDEEVCRSILAKISDEDIEVQIAAIRALSGVVSSNEEVRRALLSMLYCEEQWRISFAIGMLSGALGSDAEIRQVVLEKLNDLSGDECVSAMIWGLGIIIDSDEEFRQAILLKVLEFGSLSYLSTAMNLSEILTTHGEARRILLARLRHSDEQDRCCLLSALSDLLTVDKDVEAAFKSQAISVFWRVRQSLAEALGDTADMPEFLTILHDLLGNRNARESLASQRMVASFVSLQRLYGNERWRNWWLGKIALQDADACSVAVGALGGLVETDKEVLRVLVKRLLDGDGAVIGSVLEAFSGVAGEDEQARRSLMEKIENEVNEISADEELRRTVVRVLKDRVYQDTRPPLEGITDGGRSVGQSGDVVCTYEEARRVLLEELENNSARVRESAVKVLSSVVEEDEVVRRAMIQMLDEDMPWVQEAVFMALSAVVGTDGDARRAVLGRLADDGLNTRRCAVKALASVFGKSEDVTHAIKERLSDEDFLVRLAAVEVITCGPPEMQDLSLLRQLRNWLMVDHNGAYEDDVQRVRVHLANLFAPRISRDCSLRGWLLERLRDPRWSARLGAVLTLISNLDGLSEDVLDRVLEALDDRRGLEAYPAQLAAASFLINRNQYSGPSMDLCLEALDYGTEAWEDVASSEVRKQAALVLGKLEPLFFDERAYDKLLQVMENEENEDVRDAAYGALVRLARVREQVGTSVARVDASR